MIADAATILVIDDEPAIRRFLRTTLAANYYKVVEAENGAKGLSALAHHRPDIIILDLGLPDIDGLDLIGRIHQIRPVPIVVLSSRDDEQGKVKALDLGADDFVTKPFGIDELMARLRTALRHHVQEQGGRPVFECGGLRVDLERRVVTLNNGELRLSPKEYDLLAELVTHAGKVLTHTHLLKRVWGSMAESDIQYLRVYIRQLRQKLGDDAADPKLILTEPGVGYRLSDKS
jgi:two-component system KDP operon response regulator KdpE